ncbi:MAG: trypsin-like peptidase domain-containing protein [Lachnospiraceae bacterium]
MENNNNNNNSDSLYSYSYINQENQEHNPNFYERNEEEMNSKSIPTERTYTTGAYSQNQGYNYNNDSLAQTDTWSDSSIRQVENQPMGAGQPINQSTRAAQAENQRYYNQWNPVNEPEQKIKKKQKKQKISKEKKPHGFGVTVAKCAALALVFGLVSSTVFYGTGLAFEHIRSSSQSTKLDSIGNESGIVSNNGNLPATNVSTATTVNDVADIVDNVMPSIVSITNMGQEELGRDFFGRSYIQDTESAGSGIIIGQTEQEIYIATNNHVVANSQQLTVSFIDEQTVTATIKGTDASTDLAVLSVAVKDIPVDTMKEIKVATLGNSQDIRVGQSVVAIGNALGYGQSVTTGVISAMDREVTVQDEMTGESITNDLIQTNAAINPGNSGGALLNMNGEVIGINSVKYADTNVEGMGFSIPISAAEPIINDLITREVVEESNAAYLGVAGEDVTEELAKNFGMPEGLYITLVKENSAAAQAGLKKGDVLTEFDGKKIQSMDRLEEVIKYYAAGTKVELTIQTNLNGEWQEQKIPVTLGKKNN